jgi:hypothetical protein
MHQTGTLAGEIILAGGRVGGEPHSIFKRPKVADLSSYMGSGIPVLPADVEYRGHRIVWDARHVEGTSFWTGRAAVVSPADISGVKSVYKIRVNAYFATEREVRDHLVAVAKDRIDNGLENEIPPALDPAADML